MVRTPADARIKGDAQVGLLPVRNGEPVIIDEHRRAQIVVKCAEPLDLLRDLPVPGLLLSLQIGDCLPIRHADAALIHDMVKLLFDLEKHLGIRRRCLIGAQAQLFLIGRPVE